MKTVILSNAFANYIKYYFAFSHYKLTDNDLNITWVNFMKIFLNLVINERLTKKTLKKNQIYIKLNIIYCTYLNNIHLINKKHLI